MTHIHSISAHSNLFRVISELTDGILTSNDKYPTFLITKLSYSMHQIEDLRQNTMSVVGQAYCFEQ
jgi:hypothetical protein